MVSSLPGSSVHGILQARILEWVAHSLLQGILPTQGLNLGLQHCRQILHRLNHQGSYFLNNFFFWWSKETELVHINSSSGLHCWVSMGSLSFSVSHLLILDFLFFTCLHNFSLQPPRFDSHNHETIKWKEHNLPCASWCLFTWTEAKVPGSMSPSIFSLFSYHFPHW